MQKHFSEMEYHPDAEKLVEILQTKTQNKNTLFFRVMVAFYFCQIASMMRVSINTLDRGNIPVNMYALNLSTSGTGKGFSMGILENEVTHLFRQRYSEETFKVIADQNLVKLAVKRANRDGGDPDEYQTKVEKEFINQGPFAFHFSEATTAAARQLRHKMLMAEGGSLNLIIDEIGSNLVGAVDVLNLYLEMYDQGRIKQKLLKNGTDSARIEEIDGKCPTNMLLFGTPSKLLNGGKIEEELYGMLETGYARRCFFGFNQNSSKVTDLSAEEVFDQLTDTSGNTFLESFADRLERLADVINANKELMMAKETSIELIKYKMLCETLADTYPAHEEIRKAELSHRYFKALKLAGAYAFIDDSPEVTMDHLHQAIKLAEDSGAAFERLLTRDRPYVKLAKYLGNCRREVTLADLTEDLPFFKGNTSQRNDMLMMATSWGYKNNIIIKKSFNDGVEFLRGESLKETDLSNVIISYSSELAYNYLSETIPFDELHNLTQAPDMHWINHHLIDGDVGNGHRCEEGVIAGFNMIVLDVDGGTKINVVKELFKDYKFLLHTTKSHTEADHRMRLIIPINYALELDAKDFKEFMQSIYATVPFELDTVTGQRARKWMSNDKGTYFYNDGVLFDALPFIPKTSKNEERKLKLQDQQSLDNLERWVMNNIGDGNRNNMLLRYGMLLVDAGMGFEEIRQKVVSLNSKIADKLDESEIMATIMVSVAKALAKKP